MASLTTVLVGLGSQATLIFGAQGSAAGLIQVINLDAVNTVWVANSSNIAIGQPGVFPLAPNSSMSFDGSIALWGMTVPGITVNVGLVPGGGNYSAGSLAISGPVTATISGPVTVTGNVGITGTPTVDVGTVSGSVDINSVSGNVNVVGQGGYINPGLYASVILDAATHTIAAGGTYTTAVLDVRSYQSFSASIQAWATLQANAGASLTQQVQFQWYADAGGTELIETDTYWMWLGNSAVVAAGIPLIGGGPARGAYVSITFFNHSAVSATNVILINIYGSGRATEKLRFNQSAPLAGITSGITVLPSQNVTQFNNTISGADGIIANESNNFNMAANNTYWLPFPLYEGQVSVRFDTSVALANDVVVCTAEGLENSQVVPGAASQGCIWNPGNTGGTDYTTVLNVGRCPLYAVLKATAVVPTFTLIAQGALN